MNSKVFKDFMMSEVIGRPNNYISPPYLFSSENIVLKFWKLIMKILGNVCLVSQIQYKYLFTFFKKI